MTIQDLGGAAASLASRAFGHLRVSFVALVSSKTAWAAIAVTALAAFVAGHIDGASGKKELRGRIADLERAAAAAERRAGEHEERAAGLAAQLAALKSAKPAAAPGPRRSPPKPPRPVASSWLPWSN